MSHVLDAIAQYAVTRPDALALQSGRRTLTYAGLAEQLAAVTERLRQLSPRALGLLADNGIDWILADLAALRLGIPIIPLPAFFSPAQLQHTLQSAGIDWVLCDQRDAVLTRAGVTVEETQPFYTSLNAYRIHADGVASTLSAGTRKISFTSGTTGTPQGVCLGLEAMERVALSLMQVTQARLEDRHVCVLPLATLLENIAGVYVPLMAGATCIVPTLAEVGLAGSSEFDVRQQLTALHAHRASTVILVPQMLMAQVAALRSGLPLPPNLRFVAVGGGAVSPQIIRAAIHLGLPVHEGYGLSECASVVALNRPGESMPGCVGKVLPHVRVEIAEDGEILVHGPQFSGYLGATSGGARADQAVETGDLGYLDDDGRLYISGRKKNVFITSFGRNVSPEWVERELLGQPGLIQTVVFGEAQPFNIALIFAHPSVSDAQLESAVATANAQLPDYARVLTWHRLASPLSAAEGLLTYNGRPRRAVIAEAFAIEIEHLFQRRESHGVLCQTA